MTTTLKSIDAGTSAMLVGNQESFRFTPSGILVPSINGGGLWPGRNKLHNPCGLINQRGATGMSIPEGGSFYVDRWMNQSYGEYIGKVNASYADDGTVSQVSARHILYTCTAAVAPGANAFVSTGQNIETTDMMDLKWGSAQAKPITVRFRYAVNKPQVVSLSVRNAAGNRSYVAPLVLPQGIGNVSTLIPGDTGTGFWPTAASTAIGMSVMVVMGAAASTTWTTPNANAWQAGNYVCHSTQTNFCAAVNDYVALADWEMVIGNMPSLYPALRTYHEELALCMRYFQNFHGGPPPMRGIASAATLANRMGCGLPVRMRAAPAGTIVGSISLFNGGGTAAVSSLGAGYNTPQVVEYDITVGAPGFPGFVAGQAVVMYQQGGGYMNFSAEI